MQLIDWQEILNILLYDPERPMLFNSGLFLILFTLFYGLYILQLRRFTGRILYLLVFSIFFYYKSSGFYFVLLIISTLVDFVMGHLIYRARSRPWRRFWLFISIAVNLGMLVYFKYTDFFIDSLNGIIGSNFAFGKVFLPVGISFFTFQTMSYSIDVYRGSLIPLTENIRGFRSFWTNLLDFAFFVSFFPQLVAGPIVRAADFVPQIRERPKLSKAGMNEALLLIMGGLIKKAVISDYISVNFVDRVFESPSLYSGFENLMAIYGYAVQIYCDFSGYSDMAIGLALLLGFRLPENFRKPYRAVSLPDFWRRWHISLSSWLRDYLYISLGGNRRGRWRTYFNLMITMLLGGLWHGAGWVFIIWGGLHGLALTLDRYFRYIGKRFENPAVRSFCILALAHVVIYVVLAWQFYFGAMELEVYINMIVGNTIVLMIWVSLLLLANMADALLTHWGDYVFSRPVSVVFVFHFVTFCWVFFRAGAIEASLPPLQATAQMTIQLLGNFDLASMGEVIQGYQIVFGLIILAFLLHYLPGRLERGLENMYIKSPFLVKSAALALVIWIVVQTASSEVVPFIYFQF